jgi:hypothetical protein
MKHKATKKYTHFAVLKGTFIIVNGWDYKGTDKEDILYYSKYDIEDMEYDFKDIKILTAKHILSNGVDPYLYINWVSGQPNKDELYDKYLVKEL